MKRILFLFICIIRISIFPQVKDKPLSVVGGQSISSDEFRIRYELTPQLFRGRGKEDKGSKREFLYTLIAEKLLASYGETISLDTAEIVRYTLKSFEEMFVRDELYKQMIVEKARFNTDSLLGFYLSNASKAKVMYIRTKNFSEAEKICDLLKKGTTFNFFSSDSSLSSGDTLTISFGQFDEFTENEILSLPEKAFSKPLFIENQWYVFNSVKKLNPIIDRSPGWESEYKRLKKLAKERSEYTFYKDYMNSLFTHLNIKANGKLLKLFADEVFNILNKKRLGYGEQKEYFLDVSDLVLISKKLSSEDLSSVFVKFPDNLIPLKEFINFFRFENASFDSISYQKILDILNSKTRKFIEYKVLANEGYKYGLEKTKDVQDKFKMWKQNYYYQLVMAEFIDSSYVSDDEIKMYYNQLYGGKFKLKEVNIVEVLVKDLETAEKVLTSLENGIDIKEVTSQDSIRAETINSKGELGFKPISYFGELGAVLDKMIVGEIYGPVKVADGYAILKLVDVMEDSSANLSSFDQVRSELGNELRYLKIKESTNQFIAKLAEQNNITINEELLYSIQTTTHNSVVFNLLGFGGRITAVPLIAPNFEWVESWLNSLKVIP
jgi:parvulin-like peptidyl-prolyl isomerase